MMFEIFPWNNNLETGIDIIDEQHKRLVQLLNQLAAHLANRSHKVTLTTVFSELAAYADYHFKSEEEIWSRYLMGDELLNQHKTAHDAFFAEVQALQKKIMMTIWKRVFGKLFHSWLSGWPSIFLILIKKWQLYAWLFRRGC